MSSYENPYINFLTFDEVDRWTTKDPDGFQNWCRRMIILDHKEMATGKKYPRHRFNTDPSKP